MDDAARRYGMGRGKVFPASDARRLLNPARRLVQSPRRMARRMALDPDMRVLELGSGPGYFSPDIARAVPQGHLVVFDLQAEMLRLARNRTRSAANVSVVQGDAMRLPYRAASFDAVLIATVLGEVPDRDACVSEIRRVLRRGGTVSVAETRRDSDYIALGNLRLLFEAAELTLIARHGIPWEYVARFEAT